MNGTQSDVVPPGSDAGGPSGDGTSDPGDARDFDVKPQRADIRRWVKAACKYLESASQETHDGDLSQAWEILVQWQAREGSEVR